MIKTITLCLLLNTGEMSPAIPPRPVEVARKRGKGQRGRKRGGGGLR